MESESKCVVCRERESICSRTCMECDPNSPDYHGDYLFEEGAGAAWDVADKQIAALQARIAELESQLANTLEARAARTKGPFPEVPRREAQLCAKPGPLKGWREILIERELAAGTICAKCLHPVCECETPRKPQGLSHNLLVLDEHGCAVPFDGDTKEWIARLDASRQVARTKIGESLVSTVFLGMPHNGGPFETLIFGGFLDCDGERYETIEQARYGHELWCERVRQA